MIRMTKARFLKAVLILGFGLAVMAQSVEAKSAVLSVATSTDRGNHLVVKAGSKWKSQPVVVEVGVKSKKTWKWSRIASAKTDKVGVATMCSSKTVNAGSQLRVKSKSKVISTIKISQTVALSGCGYVPPSAQLVAVPTTSVAVSVAPSTTTFPTTTVAPTTTAVTATTAVPATTAPPTTTTLAPFTPAPNALALSVASDTGDSAADGITKATNLVVEGSAAANSTIQVSVNGTASGSTCTTNSSAVFACTLGAVAEGNHIITAQATLNSVVSLISADYSIVVDRTAPTATLVASAATANLGVKTAFIITVSENTTTLTNASLTMSCPRYGAGGLCVQEDFLGSGRNYSFNASLVMENQNVPAGAVFRLNAGAYSDVAGNAHAVSVVDSVGWDHVGPTPTVSRVGDRITITFHEVPVGFAVSQLEVHYYLWGSLQWVESFGTSIWNVSAGGSSGRVWSFNAAAKYFDPINPDFPEDYELFIHAQTDVDGNVGYQYFQNIRDI